VIDTVHTRWRRIAWNGICFDCPPDWEIGKIGQRYLLFEAGNGPVLEVKWNPVKGRFSHKSQLKRLSAIHPRRLRKTFRVEPLRDAWAKALADYDTAGFSWHATSVAGRGAIIYCPECKTATLIQFFNSGSDKVDSVPRRLLATFRDHFQNRTVPWAVFDIRAKVPTRFKLDKYRFDAGEFELVFSTKKQRLTMHRWSPAGLLLRNHTLQEIAQVRFNPDGKLALSMTSVRDSFAEGLVAPASLWYLVKARIQRAFPYANIRLWHEEDKNRILCVRLDGKQPLEGGDYNRICRNYESV